MRYFIAILCLVTLFSCKKETGNYVCLPCDLPCDNLSFTNPGTCPDCNMSLILKEGAFANAQNFINDIAIKEGSGTFLFEPKHSEHEKFIQVFYHRPKNYTADSKVLIVVPGAGRNADSYRDAWIKASEKYSVLIVSPMYLEHDYAFEDYHLGGLIKESTLRQSIERQENTNQVLLDEAAFKFAFNPNADTWLFNDFDRIFNTVTIALNSNQTQYDLFGHSAGGHILHRFALFQNNTKAHRIVASNASFYTVANHNYDFPFGLKNTTFSDTTLKNAFKKYLVVHLGELDNASESGGTFLRSKTADLQGLHRLERGRFFYNEAEKFAKENQWEFNWILNSVPNVGHDQKAMAAAAAEYLYN